MNPNFPWIPESSFKKADYLVLTCSTNELYNKQFKGL